MIINEYEHRRKLPHFQNANYLVTFVTKGRWIMPEAARDVVLKEIHAVHNEEAFIHTGIVMPDHAHLILQPLWDCRGITIPLSQILKPLKCRSSRRIKLALGRHGTVWQTESHTHQLRSDESLVEKMDYVLQNAVRAGLGEGYPWVFRWWIEGSTG